MSDSQAYEELTVTSDGVTVVKRFEEDEFPVPAIAFEFTSDRDEEVHIVLRDTVPEDIEVEDLGFHPEYGSEHWVIDDDNTIAFERDLDAGESYTTVYGIRATGSDDVEQFLTEPRFDEVDPPLEGEDDVTEDVIPESDDDVVKEAIAGDGEIPGLEDEDDEETAEDEDVETLDLKDPNNPDSETAPTQATTEDDTDDESGSETESETETETDSQTESESDTDTTIETTVDVDGDSLVASLATEIRQQNVSAEDVKLLRRAFEIAAQDGGTTAAQIQQIQTDVADLRAYTNALEEFLDENGTAQQLVEDFENQISDFESQLSGLQSTLEENSEQLEAVSSDVDEFSDEMKSLSREIEGVSSEIDDVTEKVDSIDERVDSVTDDVDSLSGDVDDVSGQVDSMDDQFEDLDDAIDNLESQIEELEEDITDGEVAERVETIEGEIEDLQTWQDQIKETFGG
jgi:predicted  nucleic acid-binding Zn-ribbon protein